MGSMGKALNSLSREVVSNVYKFMKKSRNTGVTILLKKARERTSDKNFTVANIKNKL